MERSTCIGHAVQGIRALACMHTCIGLGMGIVQLSQLALEHNWFVAIVELVAIRSPIDLFCDRLDPQYYPQPLLMH